MLSKLKSFALFLIALEFLYIFRVLLSYEHAWMHPEAYLIKSHIMETGDGLNSKDLERIFDVEAYEFSSRPSRLFSSFFDLIDTKFRAYLWRFFVPHPSISLTLLFSLFLSPFLMFALLKNLKLSSFHAYLGSAFYLASPGLLSTVTMQFRSAKPMVNFFIILCLYFASCIEKKVESDLRRPLGIRYILLLAVVIFSFFFDETALIIIPSLIVIFPKLFFVRGRFIGLFLLPFLFLFFQLFLGPRLSAFFGYKALNPFDYSPFNNVVRVQPIGLSFSSFCQNIVVLFQESASLFDPRLIHAWMGRFLLSLNTCLFLGLFFWNISGIKKLSLHSTSQRLSGYLFVLVAFHTLLLSLVDNKVWGPYWYGSYFSIFFSMWIVLLLKTVISPVRSFLMSCVFVGALLYVYPHTNRAYKKFHMYPSDALKIRDVFRNKINRFTLGSEFKQSYELTKSYWIRYLKLKKNHQKDMKTVPTPPLELGYLLPELCISRIHFG